jgi:hypothetical protein
LILGALVKTDIIALFGGTEKVPQEAAETTDMITLFAAPGSVHQAWRRVYANEPLEQLERAVCYSILCAGRGMPGRTVGHYRARWADCGRGSSILAGVDVVARHRVGTQRQRAGLEDMPRCAYNL